MTPPAQSTEGSFMPKGETNGFLLRLRVYKDALHSSLQEEQNLGQ